MCFPYLLKIYVPTCMEATKGWEPFLSDSREKNAAACLYSVGCSNGEQRERKRLRQKSTLNRSVPVTEAGKGPFGSAVWWQPEQLTLQKLCHWCRTRLFLQSDPAFTLQPWTQLSFCFGLILVCCCLFVFWSALPQFSTANLPGETLGSPLTSGPRAPLTSTDFFSQSPRYHSPLMGCGLGCVLYCLCTTVRGGCSVRLFLYCAWAYLKCKSYWQTDEEEQLQILACSRKVHAASVCRWQMWHCF